MHSNSLALFRRFGLPAFQRGMAVLEVGPDPHQACRTLLEPVGVRYQYADITTGSPDPACVGMLSEYRFDCAAAAFDIVFSANVIEHVRKPWRWLPELVRVTKAGGLVLCVNPVSWPYHEAPV